MKSGVISVIIPAYNAERVIAKCLDSVCNQTYNNIEIIVINDGSKDNTEKVVQEYANNDSRIIYKLKENGGVSSARNLGLEIANGEFVTFVDSDDYLDVNYCETLISIVDLDKYDLIVSGLFFVKPFSIDKTTLVEDDFYKDQFEERFNAYANTTLYQNVVGKLYRTEIAKKYKFDLNVRIGEDTRYNYKYYSDIQAVKVLDYCGYYYIYNVSSATHKYSRDDINCFIELRDSGTKYYCEILGGNNSPTVLNQIFVGNILGEIVSLISMESIGNIIKEINWIYSIPSFKKLLIMYKPHSTVFAILKESVRFKCWPIIIGIGLANRIRYKLGGLRSGK